MSRAKSSLEEAIAAFLCDPDTFGNVLLAYSEFVNARGLAAFVQVNKQLRTRFSPEMKVAPKEFEVVKPPPAKVYPKTDSRWLLYKPPGIIPKEDGPISNDTDSILFMLCYAAQFNVGPPEQVALRAKEMVQARLLVDPNAFAYGPMAKRFAALSIGPFTYIEEYMWTLHPFKVGDRIHCFSLDDVKFAPAGIVTKVWKAEVTTSYWAYQVTNRESIWRIWDNEPGLCPVSFPLDIELWKTGTDERKRLKAEREEIEYQQKLAEIRDISEVRSLCSLFHALGLMHTVGRPRRSARRTAKTSCAFIKNNPSRNRSRTCGGPPPGSKVPAGSRPL